MSDDMAPTAPFVAAKYLPALSAYVLAVGTLYLWGYWLPFNVNILEYAALADIVKVAALPLAITVR